MTGTSSTAVSPATTRTRFGPIEVLRPIVGGLVVLLVLFGLIGGAIRDPRPHDVPVGLVGPPAAAGQVEQGAAKAAPGAFTFSRYATEAEGRAALDSRSIDGLLVLGPGRPHLVVAGAAGAGATGAISGALGAAFRARGAALGVERVDDYFAGDPQGLILFFLVVAVLISALAAGTVLGSGSHLGLGPRVAVVAVYGVVAATAGLGTTVWMTGAYGVNFWPAAGLLALGSAAVGATVAGGARLLGPPGAGLAALLAVLLGLVASGGPVGTELLPAFYRWVAPGLPAPNILSGLRGIYFFEGAGLTRPVEVLAVWLLGGLLLMVAGELGRRRAAGAGRAAR